MAWPDLAALVIVMVFLLYAAGNADWVLSTSAHLMAGTMESMKFLRMAQIELSRPPAEPWNLRTEIDGVTLTIRPRKPDDTPMRHILVFAEVPLESRADVDSDGMIVITEQVARRSENAIERFADLAAVATFSSRTITSAVPAAGFSGVTATDRDWLANCSGLSQPAQHLTLVPATIAITDPVLLQLDDRKDGVELLTEALADTHETGRFRELARFLERAFHAPQKKLVRPLTDFLGHYDKLQYTYDEVEQWHQLRNQATHADHHDKPYVLARDVRPALMRVELAAYDVLFNKRNWNKPDSDRRDVWQPAGGVLPDQRHVIMRVHGSVRMEAESMIDGFGAYPYDRTCKISSCPQDWWLDTAFIAKGQGTIESVSSLRS